MPITIEEIYESRKVSRSLDTIVITEIFTIKGTGYPDVAEGYGPAWSTILVHDGNSLTVQSKEADRLAPNACRLTVVFSTPQQEGAKGYLQESWDLDMTAGTEHIAAVVDTGHQVHYTDEGQEEENYSTAIGLAPNGDVEGVDKYIPKTRLTVRRSWEAGFITPTYLDEIRKLTGRVNNSVFKGFEKHDLLFIGARISHADIGYVTALYEFLGESTVETIRIGDIDGDSIVIPKKTGWQYLWHQIGKKKVDKGGGETLIVEGTIRVGLASIYEEGDFSKLELSPELA